MGKHTCKPNDRPRAELGKSLSQMLQRARQQQELVRFVSALLQVNQIERIADEAQNSLRWRAIEGADLSKRFAEETNFDYAINVAIARLFLSGRLAFTIGRNPPDLVWSLLRNE